MTQIGWIDTFDELAVKGHFTEAFLFYLSYMLLIAYVLFKTIVAVVVSNLVMQAKYWNNIILGGIS